MVWSPAAVSALLAAALAVAAVLYLAFAPGRKARLKRLGSLVTLLHVSDPQVRAEALERYHALSSRDRATVSRLLRKELAASARGGSTPPQQLITIWFIRQILALLVDSRAAVRADAARALRALLARDPRGARQGEKEDTPVSPAVIAAVELAGGRALSGGREDRQQTRVLAFAEMLEAGLRPLALSVQTVEGIADEAMEPLTSALRDRSPRVRRTLCEVLPAVGGEKAVELLLPLLQDPSAEIRARAARALGEIKDRAAVDPLIQLLRDPAPGARAAAASALAEIGSPRACSALIEALEQECRRDDSSEEAAAALIEAIPPLTDGARPSLTAALGALPRPIAARLAGALESSGAVGRWLVESEDPEHEEELAALLAGVSQLGVFKPFLEALDDSEDFVRLRAASALGHGHNPAAVEALTALLGDPDAEVRAQAAAALATLDDPRAVTPLARAAADPETSASLAAISGLNEVLARRSNWRKDSLPADFDQEAALAEAERAALLAAGDEDPAVREEAARALAVFASTEADEALVELALSDARAEVTAEATRQIAASRRPRLRRLLIAALETKEETRRARAVSVLGAIGGAETGRLLVEALHDPSPQVVEAALTGLETAEVDGMVDRLIPELRHPEARVRAAVAAQLGRQRAPEAVEPLVAALGDPEEEVRVSALSALSRMGAMVRKHQSALDGRLADPSPRVRAAAKAALAALRTVWMQTTDAAQLFPEGPLSSSGAAALVDMAAEGDLKPFLWALNNTESAQSLASYLSGPGSGKLPSLLSSLRQASEWDRVRAVAALSDALKHTGAAAGYLSQLKAINPAARLTAVEIAGMLGTPEAAGALMEVLERDPLPEVRSSAASALGAFQSDEVRSALHRAHAQDPNEVVRVVAGRALERPARDGEPGTPLPEAAEEQGEVNWVERLPSDER